MSVFSNKVEKEGVREGDHIYSWRSGYIYAHHGIYVGEGKVIHFTQGAGREVGTGTFLDRIVVSSIPRSASNTPCTECGDLSDLHGVMSSCIDCFLSGGDLYIFHYGVSSAFFLAKVRGGTCTMAKSDPTGAVLHRARYLLKNGFGGYDVFKNNCEDFAIYCKTSLLVVPSVRVGRSGQMGSALAAGAAIVALPLGFLPISLIGRSVVSGGVYCVHRYMSDIGMRDDVAKIAVESLVTESLSKESDVARDPEVVEEPQSTHCDDVLVFPPRPEVARDPEVGEEPQSTHCDDVLVFPPRPEVVSPKLNASLSTTSKQGQHNYFEVHDDVLVFPPRPEVVSPKLNASLSTTSKQGQHKNFEVHDDEDEASSGSSQGVQNCVNRFMSDIGMRDDVAKIAVESLVTESVSNEPEVARDPEVVKEQVSPKGNAFLFTPKQGQHKNLEFHDDEDGEILFNGGATKASNNDDEASSGSSSTNSSLVEKDLEQTSIEIERKKKCDNNATDLKVLMSDFSKIAPSLRGKMEAQIPDDEDEEILLNGVANKATLTHVVSLVTSKDVWVAPSITKAKVANLRRKLQNIRKGSKKMSNYYRQAKKLADNLAAAGSPVSSSDLQHTILQGLDSAYDSIVTILTATTKVIHMDDFYSKLLAFELRLQAQLANFPKPAVHLANRGSSSRSQSQTYRGRPKNNHNMGSYHSQSRSPSSTSRSQSQAYRGRPKNNHNMSSYRSPSSSSSTGPCQLYGRKNHSVIDCSFRFDKNFESSCTSAPAAYVATPGSFIDPNWSLDNGATHHMTSDLSNLHLQSNYSGPDQIWVGSIPIHYVGQSHRDGTALRSE